MQEILKKCTEKVKIVNSALQSANLNRKIDYNLFNMVLKDGLLSVGGERCFAEVLVSKERGFAATRSTFDEALFDEVGLVYIFDGSGIFSHSRGNGIKSDRSSAELIDDSREQFVVNLVETEGVNIECFEGILRYIEVDFAVSFDLCEISDSAKERIGNSRRTSAASCNLACGFVVDGDVEQSCGSFDDACEYICIVVFEVAVDAESCA